MIVRPQEKVIAIFAHPGHELRCFGFLQSLSAKVLYLSDASASTGQQRLQQSSELLQDYGLQALDSEIAVSDTEVYLAIMTKDQAWMADFYHKLCFIIQKEQPDIIITDAAEGYNPVHDLCHFLTLAAVKTSKLQTKIMVTPLTEHPHELDGHDITDCMVLDMTNNQSQIKTSAINSYAKAAGGQLANEAKAMEAEFGVDVNAREILRPPISLPDYFNRYSKCKPHFERYGEQRVQSKKYKEILRLHPHLAFALNFLSDLPDANFNHQ
ncbi:MAG: hypothetical protein L3J04_00040 [Robiginitomaculum sp.]|nr:hypothetical protein [Robiginitomaculum sp.]